MLYRAVLRDQGGFFEPIPKKWVGLWTMKLLKHSLIVVALMLAMAPCGHAVEHGLHDHGHDAGMEICTASASACDCHSCDRTACTEKIPVPQQRSVVISVIEFSPSFVTLFTFSENKPFFRHSPPASVGVLASLQTVQLLI